MTKTEPAKSPIQATKKIILECVEGRWSCKFSDDKRSKPITRTDLIQIKRVISVEAGRYYRTITREFARQRKDVEKTGALANDNV